MASASFAALATSSLVGRRKLTGIGISYFYPFAKGGESHTVALQNDVVLGIPTGQKKFGRSGLNGLFNQIGGAILRSFSGDQPLRPPPGKSQVPRGLPQRPLYAQAPPGWPDVSPPVHHRRRGVRRIQLSGLFRHDCFVSKLPPC